MLSVKTALPSEEMNLGSSSLSPKTSLSKIASFFNEAAESIRQTLTDSEHALVKFQQKTVLIVEQYECDLSKLNQDLSKFAMVSPTQRKEECSTITDHALNFHLNCQTATLDQEVFTLPTEDNETDFEEKEDQDDNWSPTEESSTISSLVTCNQEHKHFSREKMLRSLTEMNENEIKLQKQLQFLEENAPASARDDCSTSSKEQLQLSLEQCQRQNCEAIAAMVSNYRPRCSKSRLHASNSEKKLKGLGFQFPTIESILRGTNSEDTNIENKDIPKSIEAEEGSAEQGSRLNDDTPTGKDGGSSPDSSTNYTEDYWNKEGLENNRTELFCSNDDFLPIPTK